VPLGQLAGRMGMRYHAAKSVFEDGLAWLGKHYEGMRA
jgi:hypothetical protein